MPEKAARVSQRPRLHHDSEQPLRDESPAAPRLALVLKWHEELKAKVPVPRR
jgi:hypothetical protein